MFESKKDVSKAAADVSSAEFARLLCRRKVSALSALFVSICIVILAFLIISPEFDATALLLVNQTNLDGSPEVNRRTAETNLSLVQIAKSEDVIREAIESVGQSNFDNAASGGRMRIVQGLPGVRKLLSLFHSKMQSPPTTALDRIIPTLSKALTVKLEPSSDIIRLIFRYRDPVTAAKFVNAVAQSFVDRQLDLFRQPGTAKFYQGQRDKFDDDLRAASNRLEAFSSANGTYSIGDQIQLLLRRVNESSSALAATRGLIADKSGQKDKLAAQLRQLRPVTLSPFVSSLVDTLAGDDDHAAKNGGPKPKRLPPIEEQHVSDAPPLLMVRVYQETMVALFKVNAELQGLTNLQLEQATEVERLNRALVDLSSKRAEFERLTQAVTQASLNADIYAKRMVAEKINAESVAAKFSVVKIVQRASVPLRPSFPNYPLSAGLGVVTSVAVSVAVAFVVDALSRRELVQGDPAAPYGPSRDRGAGWDRRRVRRRIRVDDQSSLRVP